MPQKTWSRNFANPTLTEAGRESVITRIEDNRDQNIARWLKMPQVANYAVMGDPKPGATVLMNVAEPDHRPTPLLAIQNYGRGRVGVFATAGSWRWKMLQDHTDKTPCHVLAAAAALDGNGNAGAGPLVYSASGAGGRYARSAARERARQDTIRPYRAPRLQTTIVRPDGGSDVVELKPDPLEPGTYTGDYTADKPGTYVAETTARQDKTDLGRDTLTFRREDGVAENFGAAQNRDLLEKLSSDTGGNYYTPANAKQAAR